MHAGRRLAAFAAAILNPRSLARSLKATKLERWRGAPLVLLAVMLSTLLMPGQARAATLAADYRFQNSLSSSVGSPPSLTNLGAGANAFGTETVRGVSRTVLQFPTGNGLSLAPTTGVIPNDSYSIVIDLRLDVVSDYARLVDFKNGTQDRGFYNLDGGLVFYDVAEGATGEFVNNQWIQATLTRDAATDTVVVYLDGVVQFSFLDSSDYGVIDTNNTLRFFQDDAAVPGEESSGAVSRIRLFSGALSASEAAALALPEITINDVTVAEGNTGSGGTAVFTVSLSATSSSIVTATYATANGTATAPADYAPTTGTVTFAAGDLSKTISVPIVGDTTDEPDETFVVDLSASVNGTIVDGQGVGTITDDDPPLASITDVTVTEGNSGTVDATFTVTLSSASATAVTMSYATANGTATVVADYQAAGSTVTFAPGDVSETITVKVVGDAIDEPNETFVVNLTAPVGATLADAQGTGTILDDDAPAAGVLPDAALGKSDGSAASSGWLPALGLLMGIAAVSFRRSRARAAIRGR